MLTDTVIQEQRSDPCVPERFMLQKCYQFLNIILKAEDLFSDTTFHCITHILNLYELVLTSVNR